MIIITIANLSSRACPLALNAMLQLLKTVLVLVAHRVGVATLRPLVTEHVLTTVLCHVPHIDGRSLPKFGS